MATGVEIAGLALAAFPIVVKGLTSYVDGIGRIRVWRRWRRELADYKRTLETQRISYLDTLEELLDGIVHTDQELKFLIEEPGGSLWRKPEYDERLRARLDHSYDSYLATIHELLDTLDVVQKKLGLDQYGKITWDSRLSLERELKRLKIVLSKSVYADLLAKIERANRDLREFTHQNRYLEAVRQKRRARGQSGADFKNIRKHAQSLHRVVIAGKSWKCGCRHQVHIRLEPRPWGVMGNDSSQLTFRILFSRNDTPRGACENLTTPWRLQEVDIEPKEAPAPTNSVPDPPLPPVRHPTSVTTVRAKISTSVSLKRPLESGPVQAKKKAVRFALDTSPASSPTTIFPPFAASLITDFCSALHESCTTRKCIGFLLDEYASSASHRHDVFVLGNAVANTHPRSLRSVLASWRQCNRRKDSGTMYFSRRERLFISASLASSVLQFDGSWLKKHWTSQDIFFLPLGQSSTGAFNQPYLSWEVSTEDDTAISRICSYPKSPVTVYPLHGEIFLPLGMTLMELSLGQTWADLVKTEEMDPSETIKNLKTGLDFVYDESGPRYGDVVRRCLFWPFDFREPTLDNDEFQQSVLDSIVMPLVEDWKGFEGTQRIC